MQLTEPILRDVFDWKNGKGIFYALAEEVSEDLPWDDVSDISNASLDLDYFVNHSGSKFLSPLVKYLLDDDTGVVSEANTYVIADLLLTKYLINWRRLWSTMSAEYNPIHNYNMTEERDLEIVKDETRVKDSDESHTGTDTLQHGKTETTTHGKTETTTHGKVQSTEHERDGSEDDFVYAFNAGEGQSRPTDSFTTHEESSDTVTDSGTTAVADSGTTAVADTGSDVQTKNLADTEDVTEDYDADNTEHEEIHRSGNIGVTTTQKMIEDDRKVWIWSYFEQIYKDLDRELTLPIFDPCRV